MDRRLRPRNAFLAVMAALFVAFIMLPLVCMIAQVSWHDLAESLRDPLVLKALLLTAETSCISVVIIVIIGTPVAYVLAKRDFRGKNVLDALVDLPLTLPPVVAGMALLMTFSPLMSPFRNTIRDLDIEVVFRPIAVVIAQVFVSAGFYIKAARAGFEAVDDSLVRASLVLGASRLRTFLRVTLPLAAGGLFTGIILAWARAAGEFGATIAFAGNLPGRTQTVSLAVFTGINTDLSVGLALATIMLAFSFAVLLSARILLKRSPT